MLAILLCALWEVGPTTWGPPPSRTWSHTATPTPMRVAVASGVASSKASHPHGPFWAPCGLFQAHVGHVPLTGRAPTADTGFLDC